MNKIMLRHTLALLLTCAMLCTLPVTAQAANKADNSTDAKSTATNYNTKKNLRLMSAIIYCEARGESYKGQLAVGMVVMNRVHSDQFPGTVKEVIYQKGQFTPAHNGALAKALKLYDEGKITTDGYPSCIKAAKAVLKGKSSLVLKGKKIDMSSYLFFSRYLKGSRLKIGHHNFK